MTHTLILADDLSGAADCASACLHCGMPPLVLLDEQGDCGDAVALAVDINSRAMPPHDAGIAMAGAVTQFLCSETRILFQKMDSTLRGNWARETTYALRAITALENRQTLAIVAPAFPAAGRTIAGGRAMLNGVALEDTETWLREALRQPAEPASSLVAEGLRVARAEFDKVRCGSIHLAAYFADQMRVGTHAVVCDAETEADLVAIAGAALMLKPIPLCVGSAGLMRALARLGERSTRPATHRIMAAGSVLIVVGSASQVSHAQVRALVEQRATATIKIAPSVLRGGATSDLMRVHAEQIDMALTSGSDLVVAVDGSEGVDLREGLQLSSALADLVAPRLHRFGGLIATGGETARAILTCSSISRLRIHSEVEPGVPLSTALGSFEIPVVTKAGAFGDRMTLIRSLDAIRGRSNSA